MKKVFLLNIIFFTVLHAKINVVVSILPQQTFVEKIGADRVNVTTMVKPGSDPHTYEPKPSQMVALSKTQIYFPIKVEFEHTWLDKFKEQNRNIHFIDMTQDIQFIHMAEDGNLHLLGAQLEHLGESHHEESCHHHDYDPHTWLSPSNVKIMATNIYKALRDIDPEHENYYKDNYKTFLKEIEKTDSTIKELFSSLPKNRKLMVFHPSWGYFAQEYHFAQIAIEVEGKEPKPRMLRHIIDLAKKEQINAIFTQPEFSDQSAMAVARELDIKLLKASPFAANWSHNLIKMADAIARNY